MSKVAARLDDVAPSARWIVDVLDREGPHTPTELAERTGLSYRTVVRWCQDLEERGVLAGRYRHADRRCREYAVDR